MLRGSNGDDCILRGHNYIDQFPVEKQVEMGCRTSIKLNSDASSGKITHQGYTRPVVTNCVVVAHVYSTDIVDVGVMRRNVFFGSYFLR